MLNQLKAASADARAAVDAAKGEAPPPLDAEAAAHYEAVVRGALKLVERHLSAVGEEAGPSSESEATQSRTPARQRALENAEKGDSKKKIEMEANWVGGKAPEKPAPTKPIEERSFMRATTSRNLADAPASANSTPAPGRAGAPAPAAPSPAPARPQAPPPASQSPKTAQVA